MRLEDGLWLEAWALDGEGRWLVEERSNGLGVVRAGVGRLVLADVAVSVPGPRASLARARARARELIEAAPRACR